MSIRRYLSATPLLMCSVLMTGEGATQDLHPAMNHPDKFAWGLFFALNHPADLKADRGTPDGKKKLGDPGITVWETWKLARTEVFLPNACKPAGWKAPPAAPARVAALARGLESARASVDQRKVFDPPKFSEDAARTIGASVERNSFEPANLALARAFSPTRLAATVDAGELGNETRMNREAFEFIVDRNLYSIDGQEKALDDNTAIDFPVAAKEIKAAWRLFTDRELDPTLNFRDLNGNSAIEDDERGLRLLERTYHIGYGVVRNEKIGADEVRPFGLVGLHIITKDIPNWFWATFEHVENPQASVGSLDRHSPAGKGYPPEAEGTVWQYYRLRGTQTDFVTPTGRPTVLANTQIEGSFQESSSCITCHARASIGRRLDNIRVDGGRQLFAPGTFVPPSAQVARPPAAERGYPFGATRLSVFEDLRAAFPFPALSPRDPLNDGRSILFLRGSVGVPDPALFAAMGTPGSQFAQLDFVWALRRAFRADPSKCPPAQ
ncbi:MAG: hypothetical protein AB7V13_16295 [Pseudorhodoplanes sp.]|uniref:hypothetical protein n=1 Tax=Pseudorhodoplanes sp. TaxID=1934341 RepID=UPI003D0AFA23